MLRKALFWDFDGTLIHSNESFLNALDYALNMFQYNIGTKNIKAFLHSVCSWYKPEISYEEAIGSKWWDSLFNDFYLFFDQNGIPKTNGKKICQIFKEYILNYKNYTLYCDSKDVLHKCCLLGYKNYILTNNFPELPIVAKNLGLSKYITDHIVSSNIGFEKPRVEIFRYALKIADFPDISYMIGDNPSADIEGAKNIGMKTILVHRKKFDDADYTCANLEEIPILLGKEQ